MLDIKLIRQNPEMVQQALTLRGVEVIALADFNRYDTDRRELLAEIEKLRHQRNVASDEIARKKKNGEAAEEEITRMRQVSTTIKELDEQLVVVDQELNAILMDLPNLPHESVPAGRDETDNVCVKEEGSRPQFSFTPLPHEDIGQTLGILDFSRAAKIAGARFPLYLGAGARLVRALSAFMLDIQTTEHGYQECLPPFIVNSKTMTGTGQLPKFEEDLFKLEKWDYYLIPTAEVPVTNIYQNEVLTAAELPLKYTACTPCFRSEAGSYGKDTKGLIRQHQFNKVELVKFVHPDNSYEELENLLVDAETILKRLGLAYRVVTLCAGDIGFSAAKTYDIEVWFPAQNKYREISSCSNFEDFQARRANIRFKTSGQKGTGFVHTLNGSGLAVGRTLAALLENYQQADGSVLLPEELVPYMNGLEKIAT